MPGGQKTKTLNRNNIVTNSTKTKNDPYQKKNLKKKNEITLRTPWAFAKFNPLFSPVT